MNKVNPARIVVLAVAMSLLGGVLIFSGCASSGQSPTVHLPNSPRLVGGGMMIEWKAPERGIVYLVEKQMGKIIETRTLEKGEVYSFAATSVVQADEFEQMLGIPFAKARFLLYFESTGE
jgi:hypothetical protein